MECLIITVVQISKMETRPALRKMVIFFMVNSPNLGKKNKAPNEDRNWSEYRELT